MENNNMDNEKKDIKTLAMAFEQKWKATHLPEFSSNDLLDLMDFYSQRGQMFEAELCRNIAERTYPTDPEVQLTMAHYSMDDGDWANAIRLYQSAGASGYDRMLLELEYQLRLGMATGVISKMQSVLPTNIKAYDTADFDFIYDTAILLRDYGYHHEALQIMEMITPSYTDYFSVLEARASSLFTIGQYNKAKELLNKLLDHSAFDKSLWYKMAYCCYTAGQYGEAIEACEYASAIDKDERIDQLRLLIDIKTTDAEKLSPDFLDGAKIRQDFLMCFEYAEQLYKHGHYDQALNGYGFANLYCPIGNVLQETIMSRAIICLIHKQADISAYVHLRAITTHKADNWAYVYEAAQTYLEFGKYDYACKAIRLAFNAHYVHDERLNQLALLLQHYNLYEEMREIWTSIIDDIAHMAPSYRQVARYAAKRLGLPMEGETDNDAIKS